MGALMHLLVGERKKGKKKYGDVASQSIMPGR
ncbi:hypothetical protein DPX39_090006100 [Trypanosoma brucei equiperdum]|uniref:Uncharacterized protein n=1 Tax=Trypanosoma brucei equiperdum TaxID=630700 RepID=A0A3L6L4Y9_9TRYP|nr:hypothetical protein DPX39_090006100 [Trypanosoma brucei equiperdum]